MLKMQSEVGYVLLTLPDPTDLNQPPPPHTHTHTHTHTIIVGRSSLVWEVRTKNHLLEDLTKVPLVIWWGKIVLSETCLLRGSRFALLQLLLQ